MMEEDRFEKFRKEYYILRNWTLEDHPMTEKIHKEIERYMDSLSNITEEN